MLGLFSRLIRFAPAAARYLDKHFGAKVAEQTTRFSREVFELASNSGLPAARLERLKRLQP
jgi:hypothetical protein